MLTFKKLIEKFESIEQRYLARRFETLARPAVRMNETRAHLYREPASVDTVWTDAQPGQRWGGDGITCWFRCDVEIQPEWQGRPLFVRANTDGETLFFVDGEPNGVFDKYHSVVRLTAGAAAGDNLHLAFEAYSGHYIPGCGPDENEPAPETGCKRYGGVEILSENPDVTRFAINLRVLRQLAVALDEDSLRKGKILKGLERAFVVMDAMPDAPGWRDRMHEANALLEELLALRNGPTAPFFGIIGHSHLDTAWLWTIAETRRKSARTFSSVLNLMEQYPEFVFVQSTPYQAEMVRETYPELFARIRERVAEGRWEPNGAMYVEPDCNIPSGESLVRQLLRGQRATRGMYGYTADTLWLPDVFGYSASLPQLLRKAGVKNFCTTKIAWNDTTRFPYDTFRWQGIDGSEVLSHFHFLECSPDPKTLMDQWHDLQHKDGQDRRLIAIGYGDGGGGPTMEMAEEARRVMDLEGCPRAEYRTVSRFMEELALTHPDLPCWRGELYLELHRGTLTSIAGIKRGNRKAETALRNAEFAATLAMLGGADYPQETLDRVWGSLLVNQFHDILPGSSIAAVNDEALAAFAQMKADAESVQHEALCAIAGNIACTAGTGADTASAGTATVQTGSVLALNSLGWARTRAADLPGVPEGFVPDAGISQWITDLEGNRRLIAAGLDIPALGGRRIPLVLESDAAPTAFRWEGSRLVTPHLTLAFDETGDIVSCVMSGSGREAVREGGRWNAVTIGEDVPGFWDNWDIDYDHRVKQTPVAAPTSREVTAEGPLQLRIRTTRSIGAFSTMVQDTVIHADSAQIDFETRVDWKEKHRLLKAGFDLAVWTDTARFEIQYGHVERNMHENLPQDRAQFETCMHQWLDCSEPDFGVAVLNDCKYGAEAKNGSVRVSLLKAGMRPDPRGDEGMHRFTYSVLPHDGDFSVPGVVRPAHELNVPLAGIACSAASAAESAVLASLVEIDAPNVVVGGVKRAEDSDAVVLRLNEAWKSETMVTMTLSTQFSEVLDANLLEEPTGEPVERLEDGRVRFRMKPFEVKTLLLKP